MPIPSPGNFCSWKLSEEENLHAAILTGVQRAKLQTMNVELAEALAEFTFQAGGDSGVLLNSIDFWQLRGRRSLVLQLLSEHDEAMGIAKSTEPETDTAQQQPQPAQF